MMLDVRTISLACGLVYMILAAEMTYIWRRRRTYPGFGAWVLSAWCGAAGVSLVAWRGHLSDALTVLAANLLILGAVILVLAGLKSFTGMTVRARRYAVLLVAYTGLLAIFLYPHPSLRIRLVIISFTVSALAFTAARLVRQRVAGILADASPLILSTLVLVGMLFGLRGVLALAVPPPTEDFMAPSVVQGASMLVFLIAQATVNVGLIVLNAQRVERDLQLALEECKVLRGIIPICASCKKIRDDQGAWNQVEAYIRRHTDAQFTHGICPDCAKELYAENQASV